MQNQAKNGFFEFAPKPWSTVIKQHLPAIQTIIKDITKSNCGNNMTNFP